MCSAYSGRCVLSNYFTNRDANRGGCAQICRWCFDLASQDKVIENDTKFTMSTKDLSMIKNLKDMIDIGVTSLKVEGRMRSNYYIATVISTYREAIDNYYNNTLTPELIEYYSNKGVLITEEVSEKTNRLGKDAAVDIVKRIKRM